LAESEEELLEMIRQWKDGMEQKGLNVNMGKTKVMNCKAKQGQAENSGKFPCGICKKQRCWKKLNMLHKMQEVDSQKV
jgi:hypothetical protein